jgi:hypothetical protein
MKKLLLYSFVLLTIVFGCANVPKEDPVSKGIVFEADNPLFQYVGRIDFSDVKKPRFWSPGVYITAKFKGTSCTLLINDQELWGQNHNYLEIVIDDKPVRIQTKGKMNEIEIANGLADTTHTLIISKNTESNIGYLEFIGLRCEALLPLPAKPERKIEFIGNSITCGAGSDQSEIPCGKGVWHDQHNAWLSYGAITARGLNAQYHLSSVSGVGLMHSCCNMNIIMPPVFDKIEMRGDSIAWDFKKYQPDVVTICLGQNDGIQDFDFFCINYSNFIKQLRGYYPNAIFVCLTSPMADAALTTFLKKSLTAIVQKANAAGDKKVTSYFFSKQYHSGHPDLADHAQIATELTTFVKKTMNW